MPKIGLHGAFAGGNYGDLLLLEIFLRWAYWAGCRSIAVSGADAQAFEFLDIPSDLKVVRGVAPAMAFIGGGYLGAPDQQKLKWALSWHRIHFRALLHSTITARSAGVFAVGAGPFVKGPARTLVRRTLQRAAVVVVRDDESAKHVTDLTGGTIAVKRACDAAFSLPLDPRYSTFAKSEPHIIGIHLSSSGRTLEELSVLLDALNGFLLDNPSLRVRGIVDQKGTNGARHQRAAFMALAGRIDNATEIIELQSVTQLTRAIAECSAVVSTKLHVGIVARAFGVQVISVPVHLKTPRLYRQIGEASTCHPLASVSKEWIASRLEFIKNTSFSRANIANIEEISNSVEVVKSKFTEFLESNVKLKT